MSGKGGNACASLCVVTTATREITNLQYEVHLSLSSQCTWSRPWEAAVQMWLSDVLHGDVTSWCDREKTSLKRDVELPNSTFGMGNA